MSEVVAPSGGDMPPVPDELLEDSEDPSIIRMRTSVETQQAQGWINTIKAPVEGAKAIEVKTS